MNRLDHFVWFLHLRQCSLDFQIALLRSQSAKDQCQMDAIAAVLTQQETHIALLQYQQAQLTQGQSYTH
jgi:hypothetical protein